MKGKELLWKPTHRGEAGQGRARPGGVHRQRQGEAKNSDRIGQLVWRGFGPPRVADPGCTAHAARWQPSWPGGAS